MRWDQLFADLEAQAYAASTRERAAQVDERARAELARVTMADRLVPSVGTVLTVHCDGDVRVVGTVARVGRDWLLLDEGSGREAVLNLASVLTVAGLGRAAAAAGTTSAVESRLALRSVLRAVARDRSSVRVHLVDASTIEGTIDRVGADFIELAAHGVGELRRRAEVRDVNLVANSALSAVRRQV